MKKIFTKLMLLAVAAAALVSCENNYEEQAPVVELTQTVTLSAEKPTEVRTELIEGVPYWSKGDQIGVYVVDGESYKNYAFKNDSEEASLTTSFTGETAVANTLYVYYPYTANGVAEKGAKVDIPANQEPTATSFDGKADIMLAKPVTLDAEGKQLSDLEFARLGAIVKIVLKDTTSSLAGQHVSSLTMTAANNLVGRVYIDAINQELGELYYGGAKSVTATYSEATQYEVNGTNATYVIVYPQTLAAGSTLSFEATTEGYAISKSIELGQDIVLESGKLTTLNVSLAAANVVKEETGLDLPFEDDFARIAIDASEGAISSLGDNYSSIEKIYKSKVTAGAVKFGTSSAAGHITTVPLNLSQPFTVVVGALGYKTGETVMKVTVGEVSQTINLTTSEAYYGVEFEAATKKSAVTIETAQDGKRFYLTDLKVVAGHDVVLPTLPPVLTVSKSEISVSHEAATETFTYSVANPVEGTNVAISDNADWFTAADNNGTITVTVAENTAEEAREGEVIVTYGDLTKTVTVKQAAKPAEGGNEGGVVTGSVTYTVSTTSACTTSGTAPTGSSVTYKQTYNTKEQITLDNSATFTLSGYAGVTIKAITLNMKSNASKGAGKFSAVAGSTTLAAISSATNFNKWYDNTSFGSSYRDVHVTLTNATYVIQSGENVVIKLEGTTNSIYIHSVTIDYEIGGGNAGGGTTEPDPTPDPEEPEQPGTPTVGSSYSYSFTAKTFSAVGTQTLGTLDWTFAGTPKTNHYFGYDGTKGQQFGSGNNPYNSLTLTTNNYQGGVKKIVINTSGASSINAKMTVTVGGTQIGSTKTLTATATSYTLESAEILSGEIVISYTNSSAKAIYIKSIAIN